MDRKPSHSAGNNEHNSLVTDIYSIILTATAQINIFAHRNQHIKTTYCKLREQCVYSP